jgi:uncharacterized protein YjbI with pentapeptide repeats
LADLKDADFSEVQGAGERIFIGANLENALFYERDLYGADFTEADLCMPSGHDESCSVNFTRADLQYSDFSHGDAVQLDLVTPNRVPPDSKEQPFHPADFDNADLTSADFTSDMPLQIMPILAEQTLAASIYAMPSFGGRPLIKLIGSINDQ